MRRPDSDRSALATELVDRRPSVEAGEAAADDIHDLIGDGLTVRAIVTNTGRLALSTAVVMAAINPSIISSPSAALRPSGST